MATEPSPTFPKRPGFLTANGTYGLGVLTADFDNDGWPDIYVANDSTASALYQNKKNGKFVDIAIEAGCALSADGKPQAGMGVSAADYDLDGNLDIVKTNFAGDTPSLYHNLGGANFEDATFTAGLGRAHAISRLGLRIFRHRQRRLARHSDLQRPRLSRSRAIADRSRIRAAKLLYHNLRNGRFEDVSMQAGPGISEPVASRGCAFGDFDNDGDIDVVVNTVNDYPQLLRCDSTTGQQLDQGSHDRREIESQRNWRATEVRDAPSPARRNRISRSTKCAAAAVTFRRTICAFTSASAKPRKSTCSKFAGPAGKWTR